MLAALAVVACVVTFVACGVVGGRVWACVGVCGRVWACVRVYERVGVCRRQVRAAGSGCAAVLLLRDAGYVPR